MPGPVPVQACRGPQGEVADTMGCLGNDLLGLLEGPVQIRGPVEGDLGGEQLPEGEHGRGAGKGIGNLIHCSEPTPHIPEVFGVGNMPMFSRKEGGD